jgi:hypothetical protein
MFRVGNLFDERAVVGEEQQALAVAIQPPRGVDIRDPDELFERGMTRAFIRKLRKHAKRFVEEDVFHAVYNHTRCADNLLRYESAKVAVYATRC